MPANIIPTAEPFFFPGDRTGCLLVHGFTGTPKEMRPLGEYLAGIGHTVLGVRLFAHATRPDDMLRARWRDWVASVEDGWHLLNGACDTIFIMGLSMGGALSLLVASEDYARRLPVVGVVAMSTPFELVRDPLLPYVQYLGRIRPRVEKGPPDWRNPEAESLHIAYPYYPTRAIAELRDLLAEMRQNLPGVRVPGLLMHSRLDRDGSFDPDSMTKIYERLGSREKEMIWLENSGHVITREPEQEKVFQACADFIHRTLAGEAATGAVEGRT